MNFSNQKTSLITILSSTHGRLRREQRDIDKRDLQKALKYGKRERAWGGRWKIEYDGITFITDDSMRREVTAFPSPLPLMDVDYGMKKEHIKTQALLEQKPELSTSHTVLIIDNSGSMLAKKNKIHLYRDSQNAAFSMTALEFVAEQLFNSTAVNSDLVSLIKFSKTASVEIEREPIGWPVYNKLLSHRNVDTYTQRMSRPGIDEICSMSNYLPALEKAHALLKKGYHENCVLSLFLFSDGKPTDSGSLSISASEARQRMRDKISDMATEFEKAFVVTMVGLGNPFDDFSALQDMATAAANAGATSSFEICNKTALSISSAVSSLVTSTAQTRTALREGQSRGYTLREDLTSETDAMNKYQWQYSWIEQHYVYDPRVKGFVPTSALPLAAAQSDPHEAARRQANPPRYLAVNRHYVGNLGAERVAFRCRLSDTARVDGFAFGTMVAKETKDVERIDEKIAFHEGFAETQDLANYLALEFNRHLRGIPGFHAASTPQLTFLSCSVLLLRDPNWPTGMRGVLVEKMLDTERFKWTKWNDNNGMVDGRCHHVAIDVDFELKQLRKEQSFGLGGIIEEEEEDTDDDESVSDVESEEEMVDDYVSPTSHINPSDYLQAFTHFTYRYTKKKVMVCDLQGIFNTDMSPPTFELTDPAIHYASAKGRRMVFGRTDKGRSGMNNFFKTHKCTKICKFLQLSAKNKKWNRDWRRDRNLQQPFGAHSQFF